jgi:histidine triad (HIT) family protein
MTECLFCKIASKQIPAELIYEDEDLAAFNDIAPKAPVHILIVPKKHIESVAGLEEKDAKLIGKMILLAKKLAEEKQIASSGYRLVFNTRKNSGQIVEHLHLHLIGGKLLGGMV